MWHACDPLVGAVQGLLGNDTLAQNMLWRSLGASIGSRSLLLDMNYTDMDMLNIGDDVVVQHQMWQLHTFEDRVLRLGKTRLGDRVTVCATIVMGGTTLGDDVTVLPNSVVMKGESLAAGTTYVGVPVEPTQADHRV